MRIMCPHCGRIWPVESSKEPLGYLRPVLVPTHDYPRFCRQVCPGSDQLPRDPDRDPPPGTPVRPCDHELVQTGNGLTLCRRCGRVGEIVGGAVRWLTGHRRKSGRIELLKQVEARP
jgi:hypothetical protein